VLTQFQHFHSQVEAQLGQKILCFRSDNGGEYSSRAFKLYCQIHGITQQYMQPHIPHQNKVAERKNCSLLNVARSITLASQVPSFLWAEAVQTSNFLINVTSSHTNLGLTPFQILTGHRPDLTALRIFGCVYYVHIKPIGPKLAPRSTPSAFVGYDQSIKGYRVYITFLREVVVSKDVVF
jgi:hypothetical protein